MLEMIIPKASVTGSDWNDIGEVKYLIVEPDTNEITGLVVKTHAFEESCKLIPVGQLDRVWDEGKFVSLKLTREEVEILPEFNTSRYIGITELSRAANPTLYNLRLNNVALPPSDAYLYPLDWALKILGAGSQIQLQSQIF